MSAMRFFCHICDRPLVCFEPGKRGRCPRCRARVRAPLGLAVSYQDALGRIICERDWEPGERRVLQSIKRLRRPEPWLLSLLLVLALQRFRQGSFPYAVDGGEYLGPRPVRVDVA